MTKTLHERISENIKGGCYRFRGEPEENVFQPGALDYDLSGNPVVRVWYPVTNIKRTIPFDSRILELETISVTEIDKIRDRYEKAKHSNLVSLDKVREEKEKEEKAKQYAKIAHLADHIPSEDEPKK